MAFGLASAQAASASAEPRFVVTLLGTGTPEPSPERFSAAILVEAGTQKFLFDAGRGATIRLNQLGVPLGSLNAVFLTHLHSDHVVGLPDVWLMGFINPVFGRREGPLNVLGPVGTKNLVDHLALAYDGDVKIRIEDQHVDPRNTKIVASEITRDGVVHDRNGVKVTAFEVDHGEHVRPAFAFKIDFNGRSVLISGDTKYDEKIIKFGTGVDLLIHEVGDAPDAVRGLGWVKTILDHHTTPEEAGVVFTKSKPKLAVYTHMVLINGLDGSTVSLDELVTKTRKTYSGPLVLGRDLMRFDVTADVRVIDPIR